MPRQCAHCGASLEGLRKDAKYCSKKCKNKAQTKLKALILPDGTKFSRWQREVNNNWGSYFSRILRGKRYRAKNCSGVDVTITVEDLMSILYRQDFRCALSGVPLSCRSAGNAVYHTNASLDRIVPGGAYSPENVQLVCTAINTFRSNMNLEEFVGWCIAVAEFQRNKLTSVDEST